MKTVLVGYFIGLFADVKCISLVCHWKCCVSSARFCFNILKYPFRSLGARRKVYFDGEQCPMSSTPIQLLHPAAGPGPLQGESHEHAKVIKAWQQRP